MEEGKGLPGWSGSLSTPPPVCFIGRKDQERGPGVCDGGALSSALPIPTWHTRTHRNGTMDAFDGGCNFIVLSFAWHRARKLKSLVTPATPGNGRGGERLSAR